jgi:hypothetical protein
MTMQHQSLSDAQSSAAPAPARDAMGRLLPGHGMGRPKGSKSRHNATVLAALGDLSGQAVQVLRDKLAEGDSKVAMFILARFTPSERIADVAGASPEDILAAIAEGAVTPGEANRLANAIKTAKDAAGVDEMRARLDEIEALLVARGRV